MGVVEMSALKKRRRRSLQRGLLLAAVSAELVLTMAMAPNALQLLKYFPGKKLGARFNYKNKRALTRLKEKGYVVFEKHGDKHYARITKSGSAFLEQEELLDRMNHPEKKRWDKRWRVIVFDIPERRRGVRDRLRTRMESYGFAKLQQSVWVYPHDCEEVLALVKADLKIGSAVIYMVVETIENDNRLRKIFSLPPID